MSEIINDEMVLDIIDKGLGALGESPKQAIWYYLEKDFKINRLKLLENFDAVEKAFQTIFGLGYSFLESLFLHQLHETTGVDLQGYKSFADCIRSLHLKSELVEIHVVYPCFSQQIVE
jgi:hypothetical protein